MKAVGVLLEVLTPVLAQLNTVDGRQAWLARVLQYKPLIEKVFQSLHIQQDGMSYYGDICKHEIQQRR